MTTALEALQSQVNQINPEHFRAQPLCSVHPMADKYNCRHPFLAQLAESQPKVAQQCYEHLHQVDTGYAEFESTVRSVLDKKESEFLQAYQKRMQTVGKEMEKLV